MKPNSALRSFLLGSSLLAAISMAHAADVTWDITPGTVGAGDSLITGGLGAWDTTNGNWTTDIGVNNIAWVNANNDTAIFGGTAGTATLGTGITVGGLTFNTAGYIVTGNTLTFGTAGNITANADATISSILAGAAITKTGTGTLTLTGANTYTGGTTISAGVLAVGLNLGGVGGDNINPDGTSTSLGSGDVSVAAGATLHINTAGLTIANNITLNGLSYGVNSGGPAATNSGPWNGALMGVSKTGVVSNTFSGTITLNATSNVSTNWSDKTMIITGKVTGAGGIVFDNNAPTFRQGGLFRLSNTTNDYAGDTTINNGNTVGAQPTLILGASNVIPNGAGKGNVNVLGNLNLNGFSDTINGLSGSGVITSGVAGTPTLTVGDNNATGLTYSGIIQNGSGTVALTKIGTGTQILTGNNTYTNTTISAGILQIGAGGTTGTLGSGTVLNNSALSFNRSNQISVGNVISGSGTVTHNGVGNLEILGNNSYSGGTFINSGLLFLRADLGADLGTGTVTVGSSGGANLLIWAPAPGPYTLTNNFVLNGATGVDNRAALNHDGGAGLVTLTGTVTLNATSDIGVGGGSFNNMVISGVVSGVAGAGLIVDERNVGGANYTLTLSGANTYTGPTTLTGGTLKAGRVSVANVSGAFGNNSAVTLSNTAGVVLDIAGFDTQIGSLTGGGASGGNVILGTAGNARTLTVGGDNTSPAAYAGVISQAGGLTKIGTGTQILSGTNTYTGGTNVSGGTLTFAGSSSGTLGIITVSGGGTTELKIQAGNYTLGAGGVFVGSGNGAGIVSQTGGTVAWNNNGLQLLIGNGGFAGTYNLSGGSLTTLTGTNSRGVMLGVNSGSSATFNLSGGTLTVAGTSRLMIGRSDATQINTTNLFSQTGGTATISDMTMGGTSGGAGSGNSATLTLTGGTFTATAFSLLSAANNDVSTINIGGTAVVTLPAFPTGRGSGTTTTINFDGGTLKNSVASATYMNAQAATSAFIKVGGAQFDTTNGSITITQNLLTHGSSLNGGLTKIGTNTLTLSGTNTYTGATAVNVGTLQAGAAAGGQAFGNGSAVTLANVSGATLSLNGFNQTIGSLAGGGVTGGNVTLGANATLNTGGNNTNTSYAGVISGTGTSGLTKTGSGTQTLTGANTYTGTTTVKTGTLALGASGTLANSATIVVGDAGSSGTVLDLTSKASFDFGSGQTVKGIGTINIGAGKTITINGTLAKGNSIGTQAYTGNLTLAGNDQIELGNSTGAGTYASPYNSDLGNVSGNLTLGGTLSVIDNAGANSNGSISAGSYKIYTYGGTTSGSYSAITNATGYRADIVNNGAGTGSGQGIYLDNYRVAAAATTQTVTLNTRTGVAVSTSLSITNANNSTAPYQENLGTTGFSGTTSGYTASGSATGIAGGASGSGSLLVGVSAGTVGTAGIYSGSTTLGLQTEEVNSSGLGNAGVGNQAVTINVTAYDFATAAISKTAGDGSLTGGGLSYTLDFGTGLAINTNYTATLQLANGLFSLYKDSLQGAYGTVGGAFSETAGNFASLTSGGTDTFTISFFTGSAGTFTDTLTFNGTSLNTPLGNSALSQINIGITAAAVPEPNVAALIGGFGMLCLLRRRRD